MCAKIIDGKVISDKLLSENINRVNVLKQKGIVPRVATIRLGEDTGSISYEKNIVKTLTSSHIEVLSHILSLESNTEDVLDLIQELNADDSVHGILVFKPLPKNISDDAINNAILPSKDVDGISPENLGKLVLSQKTFYPCSPEAVMEVLYNENIELKGKNVTIINKSNIFGKPLALMLSNSHASVSICHEYTDDLEKYTRDSDIVITACGVANLIKTSMLKPNAILIDAGITNIEENGKLILCGDASKDLLNGQFTLCSKTPSLGGGIGPITTALLAKHVIDSAETKI